MKTYTQLNRAFIKGARAELLAGLLKCTDAQQLLFKRMYAGGNPEMPIEDVVEKMPSKKLDWAMQQVEKTIEKAAARKERGE